VRGASIYDSIDTFNIRPSCWTVNSTDGCKSFLIFVLQPWRQCLRARRFLFVSCQRTKARNRITQLVTVRIGLDG